MPISKGIDVISVKGLSFLRFCEIAEAIKKKIRIVTDNDGDIINNIIEKYKLYSKSQYIKIFYNKKETEKTLEPSFVKANDFVNLKNILNSRAKNEDELVKTMKNDKTSWALKIFDSIDNVKFPEYINECIQE